MRALSLSMLELLDEAARAADGTVRARGFGAAPHATVTGKACAQRGLVVEVRAAMRGGWIYRITEAGRAALAAELSTAATCGHLRCRLRTSHPDRCAHPDCRRAVRRAEAE